MFTEIPVKGEVTNTLARRGVGKVAWRNVIENLIHSEKEDMEDMAVLRRLLANNGEGQKLIAQMQQRKAIRVIELTQLLHYKADAARSSKSSGAPSDSMPDWLKP